MAGPLRPPVLWPRTGLATSGAMLMALTVLMAVIPSPPAASTALAMTPMSLTLGESFTKTGSLTALFTSFVTFETRSASPAISFSPKG